MTKNQDFREIVLEQAKALAKEFVEEFQAEVARQLQASENIKKPTQVTVPSVPTEPSPVESKPKTLTWEVPKRVIDSWLKDRNTTGGLKQLKMCQASLVDEPLYAKESTLYNDNFTKEGIQKMISSYEVAIKDPSITDDYRKLLERTKTSLETCLNSIPGYGSTTEASSDPRAGVAARMLAFRDLERKIQERSNTINSVYNSDLEEEIQNQAKVLLNMVESLETAEQKSKRNPVLMKILEETLPIDQREKEAKIFSEEDFTKEFIEAQRQYNSIAMRNTTISDEERAKYLEVREAVQGLKHEVDPRQLEMIKMTDQAVRNEFDS